MREDAIKGRKRFSLEARAAILGLAGAAATLGVTFGVSLLMHAWTVRSNSGVQNQVSAALPVSDGTGVSTAQLVRGRVLFLQECAYGGSDVRALTLYVRSLNQ